MTDKTQADSFREQAAHYRGEAAKLREYGGEEAEHLASIKDTDADRAEAMADRLEDEAA